MIKELIMLPEQHFEVLNHFFFILEHYTLVKNRISCFRLELVCSNLTDSSVQIYDDAALLGEIGEVDETLDPDITV